MRERKETPKMSHAVLSHLLPDSTLGATKVSGTDFLAIVLDRADNLGIGLEAQVMKVGNEILLKNFCFLSVTGGKVKNFL